jgi:UDP-N-acetylmuramate dehydrogenase
MKSMGTLEEARRRLGEIPLVEVASSVPLSRYTRFGVGGPADLWVESGDAEAFVRALEAARATGLATLVMGGGTNLIAADEGYRGIVLRFTGARMEAGGTRVSAEAGAALADLVHFTVARSLAGFETLAGIPGWVGGAVYGNAGAYGHAIGERVAAVRCFDGRARRVLDREACGFAYRESVFKRCREWVILGVDLELEPGDAEALARRVNEIERLREAKFPASMRCAGSIFKNLLAFGLSVPVPAGVVREGKVPAAYFLERAGVKGLRRGAMRVADYHANLVYNEGGGTARDLRALIGEMKARVRASVGLELEEEVQYAGFEDV